MISLCAITGVIRANNSSTRLMVGRSDDRFLARESAFKEPINSDKQHYQWSTGRDNDKRGNVYQSIELRPSTPFAKVTSCFCFNPPDVAFCVSNALLFKLDPV